MADSGVALTLDSAVPASEGEWYEFVVTKLGGGRPGTDLMAGNATFCDSYRGDQVVDGVGVEANDFKMDVRNEVVEPMIA